MEPIFLEIHGLPAPQGSKKAMGMRGGYTVLVESSGRARPWRQDVMSQSRDQYDGPLVTGPVSVSLVFYIPRPQSHYRTGKYAGELKPNAPTHSISCRDGDIDKLARCTLDALSAKCGGCVIADDSLVVELRCEKRYVSPDRGSGCNIALIEP